jgi:hypothetical protein
MAVRLLVWNIKDKLWRLLLENAATVQFLENKYPYLQLPTAYIPSVILILSAGFPRYGHMASKLKREKQ